MEENNERTHNVYIHSIKKINESFYKDGYVYLLKGTKREYPDGFKSRLFQEGIKLNEISGDIKQLVFYQSIGARTPFISTTTDYRTAASFASDGKICLVKIPYNDVYCSSNPAADTLKENEYLVPDIIYPDEMIKSFEVDDFRGIYNYLKNEIGLDIIPEDIGLSNELFINAKYIPGLGVSLFDLEYKTDDFDIKGPTR